MHSMRAPNSPSKHVRPGLVAVGLVVALSACSSEDSCNLLRGLQGSGVLPGTWSDRCTPPPPPPTCPASCDDNNACTIDSCGPSTGFACSHAPAEQQACNDGLTCTVNDRCIAGACRGEALVCSAGACSESAGCPMPPPPTGACLQSSWAQMLPGSTQAVGVVATFESLSTNDIGDLFVGGSVWRDIVLPTGVPVGNPDGGVDLLLAKVNSADGTFSWARSFGDLQWQVVRKVAANNDGVLGFFGEFDGTLDLGAGVTLRPPVPPPAEQRPQFWTGTFLAGLRGADGSAVFAVDLGFTTGALVDLEASPVDGAFVVCGRTDSFTNGQAPDIDAYAAKFSARGELLWNASAALATSERDSCEALTVLDDGDVVLGGLHGYGPSRALWVAKLDGSTGARKWSRTFNLTDRLLPPLSPDVAIALLNDIAADGSGDLAFAGTLFGQVELGGRVGTLVVPGTDASETFSSDAMVVKLDGGSGEPIWGRLFGEPGTGVVPWEEGNNIAFDSRGDVHATGNTRTPEPAASGYYDLFQVKLGRQDGSTICARTYGGEEAQTTGGLVINRRGTGSARDQAFLLGWFNKVIDFGGGLSFQAPHDLAYFLMSFQP